MPTRLSIRVDLLHVKPPIWRRFDLIGSATFADLHLAIQEACGWFDSHLYMFLDRKRKDVLCEFRGEGELGGAPEPAKLRVSKHLSQPGDQLTYIYDFGDGWEHRVRLLEKTSTSEQFERQLTGGARAFPPEDCGGIPGYQNCVALRAGKGADSDMDLEELIERIEWLGHWQPEHFNLAESKKYFDR